jgi:integrase
MPDLAVSDSCGELSLTFWSIKRATWRYLTLDAAAYGTHTIRRTKATLIYRRTRKLRTVKLLLGHTRLKSTVRYLGIEVDDAREIAEQTEV